jgi:thioesterase domain-containing protein
MTDPSVSTTTVEDESDVREFCDRLSTSFHNRWVDERERIGHKLGEYDPLELIVQWRFEEREHAALTDGGEDTALPVDDVAAQMLDSWTHRGGGWDTWTAPSKDYRVHVEMVDLEVPPDEVRTAFEIRLDDCRDGRPFETVVRETVRNSRLALIVADELARSAACFADEWNEGLCPRPEEVAHVGD